MKARELSGCRFSRITVLRRVKTKNGSVTRWACICDCGTLKEIDAASLVHGRTKSCGCLNKEIVSKIMTTHGRWRTLAYTSWDAMIQRCRNKRHPKWSYYGGRGIKVCDRWRQFENFLADMGERPPGTTLDRYPDGGGNYEPGNCRWATGEQQHGNTSSCRYVVYCGERMTFAQLGRRVGVNPQTISRRLLRGLPLELAVTTA